MELTVVSDLKESSEKFSKMQKKRGFVKEDKVKKKEKRVL